MRKFLYSVVIAAAGAVIAIPLSIVFTLVLQPFWSFFEASFGIESIGHSGPSEWCYLAVFTILTAILAKIALVYYRMGRVNQSNVGEK